MTKTAHDPNKPMKLAVFADLVGIRLIPEAPPAWDASRGPAPDRRARLRRFKLAYYEHASGAQGADFPLSQTRQAWLNSFEAFERLQMVAHAYERSVKNGTVKTVEEPDPVVEPLTAPASGAFVSDEGDETEDDFPKASFAGGESGGGGGGSTFTEAAGGQQDAIDQQATESVADAPPEPLSESLGTPEPVESTGAFDTSGDSDR